MVQLTEHDIFRRLEQLERAVNVPTVPGEAAEWLESVAIAGKEVERATSEYYRVVHPELFRRMIELDPEQHPRVQTLEQEDGEIHASMLAVVEFAEKLRNGRRRVEVYLVDDQHIGVIPTTLSDDEVPIVAERLGQEIHSFLAPREQ